MKIIIIIILAIVASGCESCLGKFYQVHEKPTPIHLAFDANKEVIGKLKTYIDSVNTVYHQEVSNKCPTALIKVEEGNKIMCFYSPNCECYLLSFSLNKVTIRGVFVSTVTDRAWLLFREQISDSVLNRIQMRFEQEVLIKL